MFLPIIDNPEDMVYLLHSKGFERKVNFQTYSYRPSTGIEPAYMQSGDSGAAL
jgi:hypothetical protein